MADVSVGDVADLIDKWAKLSTLGQWMFFTFGGLIILIFVVNKILAYRSASRSEKNKQERAQQHIRAINALKESIAKLLLGFEHSVESNTKIFEFFENGFKQIKSEIDVIKSTSQKVLANQTGTLDKVNSLKIIEHYFFLSIDQQIAAKILRSLRENDFANRQEFIANKLRGEMGDVIDAAKRELENDFSLAVNSSLFFELDKSVGGRRYVLIDIIWNSVKPFYFRDTPIDQKCEEAALLITFVIRDYFNNRAQKLLTDSPTSAFPVLKS